MGLGEQEFLPAPEKLGGVTHGAGRRAGWLAEGLATEGMGGKESGVLGVGCRLAPRLHHSPAASHLSISLPACVPRDNDRKAGVQGQP